MPEIEAAYLNGEFLPLAQARVSVLDRGFLFADGVYEVIPVYRGRALRRAAHLARLLGSAAAIRLQGMPALERLERICEGLVERGAGAEHLSIYLQVTRGAPASRSHGFPVPAAPLTVFGMVRPLQRPDPHRVLRAVTLPDQRWGRCDIKSIALLGNVLARQQAIDSGADEALLVRDGTLTEGAACNVFAVVEGCVRTAPNGSRILPGITRQIVLDLMEHDGIECAQRALSEDELRGASELFVTSSTQEVAAVGVLDGRPVGEGEAPGPLTRRVQRLYGALVEGHSALDA